MWCCIITTYLPRFSLTLYSLSFRENENPCTCAKTLGTFISNLRMYVAIVTTADAMLDWKSRPWLLSHGTIFACSIILKTALANQHQPLLAFVVGSRACLLRGLRLHLPPHPSQLCGCSSPNSPRFQMVTRFKHVCLTLHFLPKSHRVTNKKWITFLKNARFYL